MSNPHCYPHFHRRRVGRRSVGGFLPVDVVRACGLAPVKALRAPVVGILELGGGYNAADTLTAFTAANQAAPLVVDLNVGASNHPGDDADGEVALDLQVAGEVAQYLTSGPAKLVMAWCPNSGGSTFAAGIDALVGANVDTISISWGGPEDQWTAADRALVGAAIDRANAAGIPVFVASGDNDSGDGESGLHVDFPASYPGAVGCGGTTLTVSLGGGLTETVWNDGRGDGTGGGYSAVYPTPAYQAGMHAQAFRGVPDVAGNADPATGYRVVLDGQWQVIGGTSAVAPLWAGIVAAAKAAGGSGAQLLTRLYQLRADFRDVVTGSNDGWSASVGWDPTTGLGTPTDMLLLSLVAQTAPPSPPPASPPPPPTSPPAPVPIRPLFEVDVHSAIPARRRVLLDPPVAIPVGKYGFFPLPA